MFVQIPGFPGYLVNDEGVVISTKHGKWRERKTEITDKGYKRVKLSKDGKLYSVMIHSAVANVWLGPRPPGLQVNHKDANKLNNDPSNLEYVTPQENTRHAWDNGLCDVAREKARGLGRALGLSYFGEKHPQAKLTNQQAADLLQLKGTMTQREAGRLFGITRTTVSRIWNGVRRKHLHKEHS